MNIIVLLILASVLCFLIGLCIGLAIMKSIELYKRLRESIERERFRDFLEEYKKQNEKQEIDAGEEISVDELDEISAAGPYDRHEGSNIRL